MTYLFNADMLFEAKNHHAVRKIRRQFSIPNVDQTFGVTAIDTCELLSHIRVRFVQEH